VEPAEYFFVSPWRPEPQTAPRQTSSRAPVRNDKAHLASPSARVLPRREPETAIQSGSAKHDATSPREGGRPFVFQISSR